MRNIRKKFTMFFLLALFSTFAVGCNRTIEVERDVQTEGAADTETEVIIQDHNLDEDIEVKID